MTFSAVLIFLLLKILLFVTFINVDAVRNFLFSFLNKLEAYKAKLKKEIEEIEKELAELKEEEL